jgi:hypothetical protein
LNGTEKYLLRIKLLFPVFLKIAVASYVSISLLRLLFTRGFVSIEVNEAVWNVWLPMIVPGLLILIWLNPKIKSIHAKWEDHSNQSRFKDAILVISWLTLTATLICLEEYYTTSNGKLIMVSDVNEISLQKPQRYYKIKNFAIYRDVYFE